ncbi:endospore germination permease [Bacillus sp. BRMEA1]|nr:endospore germination permease [Neobacillus endophyticus]
MLDNGKISGRQFRLLIILYIIGGTILVVPASLTSMADQDGWIAGLFGLAIGTLFVWLYTALIKHLETLTLVEYLEEIFGKWMGKFISLLYLFYLIILSALEVRNIGDFLTTHLIPETPIEVVYIIYLGIVIYGARIGIENLSRGAEIFFPYVFMLFLILVLSIAPQFRLENIQPVLASGMKPIFQATFPFLGVPFLQLPIFFMILPYVNGLKGVKKSFFIGTFIGGLTLILITLLCILVLGSEITARNIYPSYILARKINIANFFQRIEVIMTITWFITIFYKTTILFYAVSTGLAQTFNLRDHRFLTIPLGMLLMVLSIIIAPNIVYMDKMIKTIWTPYSLTFGLVLPLLLLALSGLRKKREVYSQQRD